MQRALRAPEQAELEAMKDFLDAAPAGVGAATKRSGTAVALRLASAPGQIEFNRILGATAAEQIDDLAPLFADAAYWVSLDPAVELDSALVDRGFTRGYAWQKFERGVEPFEATTTLEVVDARTSEDFADALAAGYGLPPQLTPWIAALVGRSNWHCFVAYDGETAAGAGALYADGKHGWLGAAATRPEQRGRGAQGVLLTARIRRAGELGLTQLFTETGVPRDGAPGASYRNILRAGFREAYVRPNYAAPEG